MVYIQVQMLKLTELKIIELIAPGFRGTPS